MVPKKKMTLSDYKKKRAETNQNDDPKLSPEPVPCPEKKARLEKEYERFNEELEKVDEKEKKSDDQLPADQAMNDANVKKCRICSKTGSTEEINRHLVDHFLAELNHFATLSGPAMDKACGKCPAELGNNRFHTFNFIINNRQSSVFCSWNS
jgi:hypothetical protein